MTDYNAIIRATRASARAIDAMNRLNREIMHADKTREWNIVMAGRGYMSVDAMRKDNAICVADKNKAMLALARARGRYERANLILEREKLPGD